MTLLIQFLIFSVFLFSPVKKVELISLEQLQLKTMQQTQDTLYVVNFWATWCKPCVAEMPFFEEAHAKFGSEKVKVVFVSLNYPRELAMVEKFIQQKKIQSPSYLLDAGNPNIWIDKVAPEWGGSIPATIMYRKGEKVFFHEGEFIQTQLDSIIKTKIQ
jgi:thiol-disulfide isomerase/thioredoxin